MAPGHTQGGGCRAGRGTLDPSPQLDFQSPEERSRVRSKPTKPSPAAERAIAEAEARRGEIDARTKSRPKEHGGPKGPDPVRYGDWEKKGIASDF